MVVVTKHAAAEGAARTATAKAKRPLDTEAKPAKLTSPASAQTAAAAAMQTRCSRRPRSPRRGVRLQLLVREPALSPRTARAGRPPRAGGWLTGCVVTARPSRLGGVTYCTHVCGAVCASRARARERGVKVRQGEVCAPGRRLLL